jgi:hypothetical protein
MIIINPSVGVKIINFVPTTEYEPILCTLRDDQTNITNTYELNNFENLPYYSFIEVLLEDLIENHIYDFTLLDSLNRVVYKDRLLATSQQPMAYSLNENPQKYKSNPTTNDFITYGE